MTLDFHEAELGAALDCVRAAARITRRIRAEVKVEGIEKADLSPVTIADFSAQAVIGRRLRRDFPDVPLAGEEDSAYLRSEDGAAALELVTRFVALEEEDAGGGDVCAWIDWGNGPPGPRFWTLDPIDGTKGYLRGDQYAIALALIEHGEVRLGALGCPNLAADCRANGPGAGVVLIATRGGGTWRIPLDGAGEAPAPVSVSAEKNPRAARLLRSVESAHTNTGKIGALIETLDVRGEPVALDSQAKYGVLASGHAEALVRLLSPSRPDYRELIWDQAAGSIVVEEAGGRVTDLDGKALDFGRGTTLAENRGVCATNRWLHEAFLEGIEAIGA